MTKIKSWAAHVYCVVCCAPKWLEKWFVPHALRPALDRPNRPFTRHIKDYLSVQTWWYIQIYHSQRGPFHIEELPVPKQPNNVIKVELVTNFVKAMDQYGGGFLYVKNKFQMVPLNSRKRYLEALKYGSWQMMGNIMISWTEQSCVVITQHCS